MTVPYVAVADNKFLQGANNLTERCTALHWMGLREGFGAGWQTDAHFVCYHVVGAGQIAFPRLNKPVLPKMRHMGADIVQHIFAFDYDNPEHQPWTPELYGLFWQKLKEATDRWEIAGRWSLLYTTKAGARLVYVLSEPIPVDVAEAKHRWMVHQFGNVGLHLDKLSDWTRLFRLPLVTRDGRQTWADPMYYIERWDNVIHGAELGDMARGDTSDYAEIRHFDDPQPPIECVDDLLTEVNRDTGRSRQSWWYTEAKKRLRGRECYPALFEHQPIAEKGERDSTLHKYVGQAVSMLYRLEGTTPTHVFALFVDPVQQLVPDQQTPDWIKALWSHVGRLWVREEAKFAKECENRAKVEENTVNTLDKILNGMREWSDHPSLKSDPKIATEFMQRHLIACTASNYFIMRPDGQYDDMQLTGVTLIPRIKALGMDQIIEIREIKQDGGVRDVTASQIVNKYGTVVAGIRGVPNKPGGYIENLGDSRATLVIPSYERNNELEPKFDTEVDDWLQEFFGDRYEEGCEWTAWAQAFDEGAICGLSLCWATGAGKKMFVRGLAETLKRPKVATADDLVSGTQYGLLCSPFLHIDEGWPMGVGRGMHPADQFRRLVSGQSFDCNQKYMSPIEVNNPVRVILTANNLSVVQMLTANRDLSPEDRDALGIRLKHFRISDKASHWLRMKGGRAFTGRSGRRWIAGDSNEPSDFIIAKHFLWLYHNRQKAVHSQRFLVDGDMSPEIMFDMRVNTGHTPIVIETIIKLINLQQRVEGLVIQDYRLFILTSEILEYYRKHMPAGGQKLSANIVTNVLKNLVLKDNENSMTLRERKDMTKRRWHELDPTVLLRYARRDGWNCKKLEDLVEDRVRLGFSDPVN